MMAFLMRWTTSGRIRPEWLSNTFRTVLAETPAIRATSEIFASATAAAYRNFPCRARPLRAGRGLNASGHERGHLDARVGQQPELQHRRVEPPGQLALRARRV